MDEELNSGSKEDIYHWTDLTAEKIIIGKGDKKSYTVAAGITPSGTVHIGNFREIITVDLVKRALEKRGKKVRFIYSWDDYDVFRKVPKNMPQPEILEQYLRKPIINTPDTFGCHASYAEHHEKAVEEVVPRVGIFPEFLYQSQKYRSGEYVEEIKFCLEHTKTIKTILDKYREKPHSDDWLPITLFCEKCGKDTITSLKWKGGYQIEYCCECGHQEKLDFKKRPIVKLKWRVDWAMRQHHERVDFEPAGKEHYAQPGGSRITSNETYEALYQESHPLDLKYDFIIVKGSGGKMSSSLGNVVDLKEVLEIYEPEVLRYLFAATRPNKEFAISFDADVLKIYEDFDKCERIYFGVEKVSEKEEIKQKAAYELSSVRKLPKTMPYQPGFRHLTTLLQIHSLDVEKSIGYFKKELKNAHDKKRIESRAECAKNWLEKYAPEEFKFTVQEKSQVQVTPEQRKILQELAGKLLQREWTDVELHEEMYILCKNNELAPPEFFKTAYRVLINKERGPRLAAFMLAIGKEKAAKLLESAGETKKAESSLTIQKQIDDTSNYHPITEIFEIQQEVLRRFPGLKVGIAIIKGVTVRKEKPELEKFKKEIVGRLIEEFKTKKLEDMPLLEEYKRIYRATGVDPTKQKPSPLALLKRVKEGKELYTVNTVVDVYNLVVMKTRVSMGAFDLQKLKFPTYLRFAEAGEEFIPLLEDKPKSIKAGELVYADVERLIFCQDLNYRDSDFTKITERTKDLILYVDGTRVTSNEELQEAMNLAVQWIIKFCGGRVEKTAYTF